MSIYSASCLVFSALRKMVLAQFPVLTESPYSSFSYTKWLVIPDRHLRHMEDFDMLGVTNKTTAFMGEMSNFVVKILTNSYHIL